MEEKERDIKYLYDAIRAKLGTEYKNIFDEDMRDDVPGDVGIFMYTSSNDVETLDGTEVYNCIKVHIKINAEQSSDGLFKAINYLSKFTHRIENETSDIPEIGFVSAKHIGPRALKLRKNEYGISVCVCNIDLKYIWLI